MGLPEVTIALAEKDQTDVSEEERVVSMPKME